MTSRPRSTAKTAHVESLTQLDDDEWDAALRETRRPYRFSHRAAAGRVLEAAYPGYRFIPYRAEYEDGSTILYPLVMVQRRLGPMSMALGMPLGWEGTPLPLTGTAQPVHLQALFDALEPCGVLKLHGGAGGSPPAAGNVSASVTHTLDVSGGFEVIWEGAFTASTRNMCRKAERGGLSVVQDSTPGGADAYYALYAESSRGWGYTDPPYPHQLFTALLASGHAQLWLGRVENRLIAGAVLLRGSEDLFYWSGAMDRDYRSVAPSNGVLRVAIEAACAEKVCYLDFGASTGLPGVEAFKRSFGAQPREYRTVSLSSWRYRQLERVRGRASRPHGRR